MKFFLSHKEETYLNYKKINESELDSMDGKISGELLILPGTVESKNDTKQFLTKIKKACSKDCNIIFNFVNIYQLFNDVAFHRIDVGVGHLVCRAIEKPFNVQAASNCVRECNFKIQRISLSDQSKFIRIECTNE